MFIDEVRRAIQTAPRAGLPAVSQALWAAVAAGEITETDAEDLDGLLRARMAVVPPPKPAPRRVGSQPRSAASLERRRRWGASGRLPPQLAASFTLGETAALAVVAAEVALRGDCRLTLEHIAAVAGVSRSTVKAAIRHARTLGFITVEERRRPGWRSLSNVVRVVSKEWVAWMRLGHRSQEQGGGGKFSPANEYKRKNRTPQWVSPPSQEAIGRSERGRTRPARPATGQKNGLP